MQADGHSTPAPERIRALYLLAFALTTISGLVSLWTPFDVDQSLFTYGGRTVAEGETLYRDFWDIKQPGIFFFYALAGSMAGFIEPGIHALELLWQLAGALVLTWIARQCVWKPAVTALVPIATVAAYYAFSGSGQMTQVEAMVGPPLAVALAAAFRLTQKPESASASLLLGAATALVGAFKLVYLALPFSFASLLVLDLLRRRILSFRILWRVTGFALLGVIAIWLPLVGYFALHGALPDFLWANFGYPAAALNEIPLPPTQRLQSSFEWTLNAFLPFGPLILVGAVTIRRSRQPLLALAVLIYLLMGIALIVLQRFSWWDYHQVLLFPPLGLLAVFGLDRIVGVRCAFRRSRFVIALVAIVAVALPLAAIVRHLYGKTTDLMIALKSDSEARLSIRLDDRYLAMWTSTMFLDRRSIDPDTVYVFGDPRYVLLSNRRQAMPVHGHAWEHLPEAMWKRLPSDLMTAQPAYVFLSDYNKKLLGARAPELLQYLQSDYRPLRRAPTGRWLVRIARTTEPSKRPAKRPRRKRPQRPEAD